MHELCLNKKIKNAFMLTKTELFKKQKTKQKNKNVIYEMKIFHKIFIFITGSIE